MPPKKTGGNSEPPEKKQKLEGCVSDVDGKIKMLLGLSAEAPPRPPWPTDAQIADGTAMPVEKLAAQLYRYVTYMLSLWCYKNSSISLRKPLYQLECPKFSSQENGITDSSDSGNPQNAASGARVTTFKEPWDMENCKKSLMENGIYEAATPTWKTNPIGQNPPTHHTYHQLEALSSIWSEESYTNSSSREDQRRFIVHGFILTHVDSIQDVESILAKKSSCFKDLPIVCGHLLVWSLLRALDLAFADGKEERILRLFEASLSVTLRMRLAPSNEQKILDKLTFSDSLRSQALAAGVESFFDFATFVGSLDVIHDEMSGPKLQETCKTLGITYNGKPLERNLAYAILAILPYTRAIAASSAVKSLETVAPSMLADPTKVMRACTTLKKNVLVDDWIDAFVYWIESLHVDTLCGDMKVEEASTEFLVGAKKNVGYLQVTLQKRLFAKWFLQEQLQHATTSDNCTARGLAEIMQKTSTPLTFFRQFSPSFINANPGVIGKGGEDLSLEIVTLEAAIAYFRSRMQAVGDIAAAELMCRVMVNRYADDFQSLAASGAKIADFLTSSAGEGEEESSLASAYAAFKKTLQSAPVSTSVVDSGAVYDAIPGDEDSEERMKLYNHVIAKRRDKIIFYHLAPTANDIYRKGGPLTQILHKSKFIGSTGDVGKSNSLLIMSADLFPNKATPVFIGP